MKTIEERAKEYAPDPFDTDEIIYTKKGYVVNVIRDAYIVGANTQKEIDEEVRLKNCDDMTQAEYDRESAFAEWYHKNRNGTPTFSDAIEWARKDLLDKASKWLKENARDYACATVRCPYGEEEEIICDVHLEIVEEFRKAMEE